MKVSLFVDRDMFRVFKFVAVVCVVLASVNGEELTKCYTSTNSVQYCYHTNGSQLNWSDARQLCFNRNSTLPIVTDQHVYNTLEQFLTDANSMMGDNAVWIGARALPVNNSVKWHWINGQPSTLTPTDNLSTLGDKCYTTIISRRSLSQHYWNDKFYFICQYSSDSHCTDGYTLNGQCYRIHNESVTWFMAVNRCLLKNASLAVFDDNILTYVNISLIPNSGTSGELWIGLLKAWWTWPDAGGVDMQFNKFSDWPGSYVGDSYYPTVTPNSGYECIIARTDWQPSDCSQTKRFVCRSDNNTSTTTTTKTTTTHVTLSPTPNTPLTASIKSTTLVTLLDSTKGSSVVPLAVGLGVGLGLALVIVVVVIIAIVVVIIYKHRQRHSISTKKMTSSSQKDSVRNVTQPDVIANHVSAPAGVTNGNSDTAPNIVYASIVPMTQLLSPETNNSERNRPIDSAEVCYAELLTVTVADDATPAVGVGAGDVVYACVQKPR